MTLKQGKWSGFETPKHHQAYCDGVYTDQTLADRARLLAETIPDEKIFPNDSLNRQLFASILDDAQALAASLSEMGILPG